jgi:hypothetical protein
MKLNEIEINILRKVLASIGMAQKKRPNEYVITLTAKTKDPAIREALQKLTTETAKVYYAKAVEIQLSMQKVNHETK